MPDSGSEDEWMENTAEDSFRLVSHRSGDAAALAAASLALPAQDHGSDEEQVEPSFNSSFLFDPQIFTRAYHEDISSTDSLAEDEIWLRDERARHRRLAWYVRPSMYMVSMFTFIYTFANGLSYSSKLQLTMEIICTSLDDSAVSGAVDDVRCNTNARVQEAISNMMSVTCVFGSVIATLTSGRIGQLSDQHGRKRLLLVTVGLQFVSKAAVLALIHPTVVTRFHPYFIVAASCIENFGGGLASFMSLTSAYLADVAEPHERIMKMSLLTGCAFCGMGLGPFVGSAMVRHWDSNWVPCYTEIATISCLILFCLWILPESRSLRARVKSRSHYLIQADKKRLGVGNRMAQMHHTALHLFEPLKMLAIPPEIDAETGRRTYRRRLEFYTLMSIFVFYSIGSVYMGQIFLLYPTYAFKWTSVDIGVFLTIMMASRSVVLLFVSPVVLKYLQGLFRTDSKRVDRIDLTVLQVSLIFEFIGAFMMTSAENSGIYKSSQLLSCFGALLAPTIDTILIKYTPIDKVGQMMGALSMCKNFLGAVAPSLLLRVYSSTVKQNPRTVFYVMMFATCASALSGFSLRSRKADDDDEDHSTETPDQDYGATTTV